MALTDVACRNAKAVGRPLKISDSGGLHLLVMPTGSRLWRLAYRFGGKQKTLAFGTFPEVGLRDARRLQDDAKALIANGIDPGEAKKQSKRQTKLAAANTFERLAREWFGSQRQKWVRSYSDRIWSRIEADILPTLGNRPINQIEPPELLEAIRSIERRGAIVLAKRMLQICGQIFRYAVASGHAVRDPAQDLRGALRAAGPVKRRKALKSGELPAFLIALDSYSGDRTTALGLKLALHTMVRTSELRLARWDEIESRDGPKPLWRIPAERMKGRREHLVPLSRQSVAILAELSVLARDSEFILPSDTRVGPISSNTLLFGIYRLGWHSRATVHGFRGTASTILNERGFNRDWIERQLAHIERNDVRAAYNAAEWMDGRREMLDWWSDYLDACQRAPDALKNAAEIAPARQH